LEKETRKPKSFEATVFNTIRDYVARNDPEGLQHIKVFEESLGTDKENKRTNEFDQYLIELLSRDSKLHDELITELGGNNQFVNIVTGGHVEKIVNIAKAGAVHIHQKNYLITHQSFVLLLSVIIIVSLVGGGVYWQSLQPRKLEGDFNIAVATFDTDTGTNDLEIAETVSKAIYQFIDREFNSKEYNLNIDVEHKNIGVIAGEDRAEELARSINANVVIYGTVKTAGNSVIILPRFYVANSIKADAGELIGFHQLEMQQGLEKGDLQNLLIENTKESEKLLQNSEILINFTQGLTYLVLSENKNSGRKSYLRLALESIEKAITKSNELKNNNPGIETGSEVLYLFASYISLLLGEQVSAKNFIDNALLINGCYGRAYIAQGNIFYDMGVSAHAKSDGAFQNDFDQAISSYNHALELDANHADCEIQPYGYYLPAKAYTGLGNVNSFLFQVGPDAMDPALAEKALNSFEQVIAAYDDLPQNDPGKDLLTKLAANAQYQSGVVFLIQKKSEQAIDKFKLVIQLKDCSPLANKAKNQIERLGETVTDSCGGTK
jgi:tetratricopeptide (TPR) repeat protein